MKTDTCSAGCRSERGEGLRRVSAGELKLTPLMLAAAKMQDGDQLLLCSVCGRVVRRTFDSYVLHFRLESLGTYDASRGHFEPKPWLQHEMKRMTMVFPMNIMELRRRSDD